jgi:hypothetical protein
MRFIISVSTMNAMRPGCSWNRNVIHCSHSHGQLLQAVHEKKFYYGAPSTCGAQWEDFAFQAHVDQQDIHISEGRNSRKGSTE